MTGPRVTSGIGLKDANLICEHLSAGRLWQPTPT